MYNIRQRDGGIGSDQLEIILAAMNTSSRRPIAENRKTLIFAG
jgi:hypothetical protein